MSTTSPANSTTIWGTRPPLIQPAYQRPAKLFNAIERTAAEIRQELSRLNAQMEIQREIMDSTSTVTLEGALYALDAGKEWAALMQQYYSLKVALVAAEIWESENADTLDLEAAVTAARMGM